MVGVDISEKLLQMARDYEVSSPLGIEYIHDDAGRLSKLPDSSFDGVVCHWSLVTGHWSLVTGHWSLVTGQHSRFGILPSSRGSHPTFPRLVRILHASPMLSTARFRLTTRSRRESRAPAT